MRGWIANEQQHRVNMQRMADAAQEMEFGYLRVPTPRQPAIPKGPEVYGPQRPALYLTPFYATYEPGRELWPFGWPPYPEEIADRYGNVVLKVAAALAAYPGLLLLWLLVRAMGWVAQ